MSSDWMDDFLADDGSEPDAVETFYCPYTNGAECALMTKGWQPQELCDVLECEQLKNLQRRSARRHEAA